MFSVKRCGRKRLITAASPNQNKYQDGYITTLHAEGSFDGTKINLESKLVRPEINYWKVVINVLIPVIVYVTVCWWNVCYALVCISLYFLIRLRKILVFFIRVYQRYASAYIRLSCVFEPSCSEYMRLALEKYGVIRGIIKGIKRLLRCHYPNGGTDYP